MTLTTQQLRLEAAQRAERLLTIPFCPHSPADNPKQARFLLDFRLEALYGGAAGGGKSDGLLMAALQFVHVPGYAALILRRTFRDLDQPGALMDRAREWFDPTPATWSEKRHAWRFPSGAIIQFGYLEHDKQRFRYQSAEFQFIGFDELTQFSQKQYRYLFTRLRRPMVKSSDTAYLRRRKQELSRVPLRMRGATNPGGVGHDWVKRRFIENSSDRRAFYPATLYDNPFVDQESYLESLAELDPVTRAQMEQGDWEARQEGGLAHREWFRLLDEPPEQTNGRVRYWDLAASDPRPGKQEPDRTSGALCSLDKQNRLVVEDITKFRSSPGGVEEQIKWTAERDGKDVPIFIEQEGGASGKSLVSHYRRNVLAGFTVTGHTKGRGKVQMASPWLAMAKHGEVLVVDRPFANEFFDEVELFGTGVGHDDQVDSVSGAYSVMASRVGTGKVRQRTTRVPAR